MKKYLSFALAFAICASTASAKDLSEVRFYLNPGHGSWGPNDRPCATIPYPNLPETGRPDTCGFYESNTNLWKALKVGATLEKMGAKHENIMYSRVKTGPYPYVKGADDEELYNRDLSEICEEVCANNIDMFFSIHSNAATEGSNTNYPLFEYRGKDGKGNEYVTGSYEMCETLWPLLYSNGIDPMSYYSPTNPNLRGDVSFNGWSETGRTDKYTGETYYGKLGVLKHNAPGLLSEGYFHTYQPARHRALNIDYCHQEGVRYARGIAKYFNAAGEKTGYIMGTVKDLHEKISNPLFNYSPNTNDQWLPLNGTVVNLYKDKTLVKSYTVDNNYNGVFVFEDLEPGNYTLDASLNGYKALADDYKNNIVVKANETTYPMIYLESDSYTPPAVIYTDYPDPKQDDNIATASEYTMTQTATDLEMASDVLQGKTIRRTILRDGFVYILALDETNVPYIYQIDPATQAVTKTISTQGTKGGILALADIAFTADNVLVGCNKGKNQYSDDQVDAGETRGIFRAYKWSSVDENPTEWFTSTISGNYYRAYTGNTLAISGTAENCTLMTTAVTTGSASSMRFIEFVISNNQLASTTFINKTTSAESNYTTTKLGEDMQLNLSPLGSDRYIIDGSNSTPIEFTRASQNVDAPLLGKMSNSLVSEKANGATFFKYAHHSLMASPYTDADGKCAGVKLFDITNGLNNAELISTTNTDLPAVAAAYTMAAGVVDNADITLYVTRDNKISQATTKGTTQPVVKNILAYNLNVEEEENDYKFSFKSNSDGKYGKIIFTNEDKKEVGSVDINNIVLGDNTVTVQKTDMPIGTSLNWAVSLTGNNVGRVSKLNTIGKYTQGSIALNNSTESDKFGNIYVNSRYAQGSTDGGLYEYTNDGTQLAHASNSYTSARRVAVDAIGNVYVANWGDPTSGVYRYDKSDITSVTNMFDHDGATRNSDGLWSINGTAIGGSTTSVAITGAGADTKLITYDEDYAVNGSGNNVLIYNLGSETTLNKPNKEIGGNVHSLTANTDVQILPNGENGFWASQTRVDGQNISSVPSLCYFDYDGNTLFNSGKQIQDILTGSHGSGFGVSGDNKLLAINNADSEILIFDINWDNNVPTLTYKYKFKHNDGFAARQANCIYQIDFDRANNIYIAGKQLGIYSTLSDNNTCVTPAKSILVVNGKAPVAPLEVSGTNNNDNTATIYWTAPASKDVTGYNVYIDNVKDATLDNTATEYTFKGISDNAHELGVSALYNDIESDIVKVSIASTDAATAEKDQTVTVSPNPTEGVIYINTTDEIKSVKVYSTQGALVYEGNSNTADLSNLANGTYVVLVNNLKHVTIIKK